MSINKQFRINDDNYPQVIITQLPFLNGEYQIEQGTGSQEVNLSNFDNDVVSISRDQAIKLAKTILEFEGELV